MGRANNEDRPEFCLVGGFMVPHPPLIIPDIGKGREAQIADTINAYETVAEEIAALEPDTIIIASPHSVMYSDYFHISPGHGASGSFASFGAPDVSFSEHYDGELVSEITKIADELNFPAGTLGERDARLDHATLVPLWFIRNRYKGGSIVRIGLSGLPLTDHYRLGMIIRDALNNLGRRAVFVASGDLSHKLKDYGPYGYAPEGPEYDKRIMDVMGRAAFGEVLDFDETFCERAAECGHRSFAIMAGAFDGVSVRAEVLSYQDVTGVGYGICSFLPESEDENRHFLGSRLTDLEKKIQSKNEKSDPYVRLARRAIESYVLRGEKIPVPDGLSEELKTRRAGAFVSIHKFGGLRGCIGTTGPTRSCLAEEIICNAISASTKDPRFPPVRPDELRWLEISVDVLSEPEEIRSKEDLDVKKYGVIVESGAKRGLLLPDLDGVDTADEQIAIAMRKAGITSYDGCRLKRFEVVRHF